jgi:hypothetical protein
MKTAIIAVLTALALAIAPSASGSSAPTVHVVKIDQATIDGPASGVPGLYFGLNASNLLEVSPSGDVVRSSSSAVGNIVDVECFEFGCGAAGVATCYPTGNPPFLGDLPTGALKFGPEPGTASLQAKFDCSGPASAFQVNVNVRWTPDDSTVRVLGIGGPAFWFVPVTGTVSDGTGELLHPGQTGVVIERTDHFVARP